MNYNVKLALWWSLWENMSASVRSGDVLSALLFLLTQSNATVGVVQGINGVLQLLAALPAGWLADRHRRDTMLRAGAAVGAVAGGVLAYALALQPRVWLLGAAMALLGCYRGCYNAALEAIFADSIQQGRSSLYTKKHVISVVASSFGPWLSLLLFHRLGNRWVSDDCRLVLLSGVALMAVPLVLMCLFDDDRALSQHCSSQAQQQQPGEPVQDADGSRDPLLGHAAAPAPTAGVSNGCADGSAATAVDTEAASPASVCPQQQCINVDDPEEVLSLSDLSHGEPEVAWPGSSRHCSCLPDGLVVTLLISVSDFIGAFASGMTIKFFALFFFQEVGFSPMLVSLLGALSPMGISAASLACQPLSKFVGRVQISLMTRSLDITLLVAMAYLPTTTAKQQCAIVAVHLMRTAVANATRPLMRSVLMDFVPRQHRGKVNAIDSIRSFSWSGSAALGGFLIESIGFRFTFLVTACMKLAAFVPLFFLLAFVPDGICLPPGARTTRLARQQGWQQHLNKQRIEEAAACSARSAAAASGCRGRGSGDLQQPLLASS